MTLDGRGIRDMTRVQDGFLVLAGPLGDSSLSQALYFWDGESCLPGEREAGGPRLGTTRFLGAITTPAAAKAEGVLLEKETADSYEILVLYDGADGGGAARFHAPKPR